MPFIHYVPFKQGFVCNHPAHDPPGMIVLPPGIHTYQCPKCGKTTRIVIPPKPRCKKPDQRYDPPIGDRPRESWVNRNKYCWQRILSDDPPGIF